MTTSRFEFLGLFVAMAVLASLFARNLQRARASGELYSRSVLVSRAAQPISFWITVVTYAFATVLMAAGAMFSFAMAVFPDIVAGML